MRPFSVLFRFLLRSFFCHPLNNPVWPLLGIITVYFVFEGSLKREHVLLLTCAFPFLHLFLGTPFRHADRDVPGFFERLPLSHRTRFFAFMAASAVYMALAVIYFGYLLRGLGPVQYFAPDARIHYKVTPQGDTLTLMTGTVPDYIYGERPAFKERTVVVEGSVVFDGFFRIRHSKLLAALYYVSLLGVVALVHYRRRAGLLGCGPLILYAAACIPILVDPYLTHHFIVSGMRTVVRYQAGIMKGTAAAAAFNAVAGMIMFAGIMKSQK